MTLAALESVNVEAQTLSSSRGKWRVVGARKRGSGHEAVGTNCEDAYRVVQPAPGMLVAAVADGAGSAAFAEIGANVAVESGITQVCAGLEQSAAETLDDATLQRILEEALAAALSAVQLEGTKLEVDSRELASTMILMIAHPEFIAAAQIGDGATVVAYEPNEVFSLTRPHPGEYLNETVFLTSRDALQTAQIRVWRGRAFGIAAFSDGLQMLCLKWPEFEPHGAFFTPLFNFVRNTSDEARATTELTSFLMSERVEQLTDDDVTLVVAVLGDDQHDDL